ncbi:Protein CBG25685 [Caenorhabditis briggsae]|uniref:Protein CBG25685 n=1 Tax=Caenorhabditis briggsae TaxID=6238 RepID=B6ILN0_CAEBR|nr:Protein CBG25685 [Caenorhabditis briggsae]CAS00810.1 Protein CBG25685 [Caenorhabditis briggsae]
MVIPMYHMVNMMPPHQIEQVETVQQVHQWQQQAQQCANCGHSGQQQPLILRSLGIHFKFSGSLGFLDSVLIIQYAHM